MRVYGPFSKSCHVVVHVCSLCVLCKIYICKMKSSSRTALFEMKYIHTHFCSKRVFLYLVLGWKGLNARRDSLAVRCHFRNYVYAVTLSSSWWCFIQKTCQNLIATDLQATAFRPASLTRGLTQALACSCFRLAAMEGRLPACCLSGAGPRREDLCWRSVHGQCV